MVDPFAQVEASVGQAPASQEQDPFSQVEAQVAAPMQKQAAPAQDPFAQVEASVNVQPPVAQMDPFQKVESSVPGYSDVQKTKDRSFWSAPLVNTEKTTDAELEAIAKQHGVDPEALKSKATFQGAVREGDQSSLTGELASSAGRIAANLPQFASKKMEQDPNMRAALDDVRELGNSKRSFLQGGTELAAGMALPVGVAGRGAGYLARLGGSAAIGGAYGLGGSSEGQEALGTGVGAVAGAGLHAATEAVAPYAERGYQALKKVFSGSPQEAAIVDRIPKSQQAELGKGIEETQNKLQQSEGILQDTILNRREEPSSEELETLAKEQLSPEEIRDIQENVSKEHEKFTKDAEGAEHVPSDFEEQVELRRKASQLDTEESYLKKQVHRIDTVQAREPLPTPDELKSQAADIDQELGELQQSALAVAQKMKEREVKNTRAPDSESMRKGTASYQNAIQNEAFMSQKKERLYNEFMEDLESGGEKWLTINPPFKLRTNNGRGIDILDERLSRIKNTYNDKATARDQIQDALTALGHENDIVKFNAQDEKLSRQSAKIGDDAYGGVHEPLSGITTRQQDTQAKLDEIYSRNPQARDIVNYNKALAQKEQILERLKQIPKDRDELYTSVLTTKPKAAVPGAPSVANSLQKEGYAVYSNRLRDFAEHVTGERPATVPEAYEALIKGAEGTGGPEQLAHQYSIFQQEQVAKRVIRENQLRLLGQNNFSKKALDFIQDPQYVLQHIDDTLQLKGDLSARLAGEELSNATGKLSYAAQEMKQRADELHARGTSLGMTEQEMRDPTMLLKAEQGRFQELTPNQQKFVKDWNENLINKTREVVNSAGNREEGRVPLTVGELTPENGGIYVPHRLQSAEALTRSLDDIVQKPSDEIEKSIARKVGSLTELTPTEVAAAQETPQMKALNFMGNMVDLEINSGSDIQKLMNIVNSREGRTALSVRAKAAMERTGEMPQLLRETDPFKLGIGYGNNLLTTSYLRSPIEKMNTISSIVRSASDDPRNSHLADYLNRRVQNTVGVIPGSLKQEVNNALTASSVYVDRLAAKYGGSKTINGQALLLAKELPRLLMSAQHNIYPNRLGWNPKIVLQHSLQLFTKTMPELGAYGPEGVAKGMLRFMSNRAQYIQQAERAGLIVSDIGGREGQRALAEGIMRSGKFQGTADKLQAISKFGMSALHSMVNNSRALMMAIGDNMAREVLAGDSGAINALNKLPPAVRDKAMQYSSNPTAMAEVIGSHLNSSTMYNYNRASMSDYGAYLGPLFSAFTKFPMATVGDIARTVRSKGALGSVPDLMLRYGTPAITLSVLQHAIFGDPQDMSPAQKKIIGSSGLGGLAPVNSLKEMSKGQLPSPIILEALMKDIVRPLIHGEDFRPDRGPMEFIKSFTPLAGPVRFIIDDMPAYLGND